MTDVCTHKTRQAREASSYSSQGTVIDEWVEILQLLLLLRLGNEHAWLTYAQTAGYGATLGTVTALGVVTSAVQARHEQAPQSSPSAPANCCLLWWRAPHSRTYREQVLTPLGLQYTAQVHASHPRVTTS